MHSNLSKYEMITLKNKKLEHFLYHQQTDYFSVKKKILESALITESFWHRGKLWNFWQKPELILAPRRGSDIGLGVPPMRPPESKRHRK